MPLVKERNTEKVTIYNVAAHANVGISTVSRVLNGSDNVAEKTRLKVLASIEELQFRPNRTAKALAQPTSRTLAVAFPTFITPFHNELLKGIRHGLQEASVDLLLCDLDWTAPKKTLMDFLSRGAMDGLILAGVSVGPRIGRELKKLRAPVMLIGSQWRELDSITWDEKAGVRLAVSHLIEKGHRRIGMITTHVGSPLRDVRLEAYQEALGESGIEPDARLVATGHTDKHAGFSEEAGYEAMQRLLEKEPSITAVFASSDVHAIGAWNALCDRGVKVPEEVALVGYDDIKVSRFIGLTSVAQNMHGVGEEAIEVLLRRIEDGRQREAVAWRVTPELMVRKTT